MLLPGQANAANDVTVENVLNWIIYAWLLVVAVSIFYWACKLTISITSGIGKNWPFAAKFSFNGMVFMVVLPFFALIILAMFIYSLIPNSKRSRPLSGSHTAEQMMFNGDVEQINRARSWRNMLD